jgi:hypothetical protein
VGFGGLLIFHMAGHARQALHFESAPGSFEELEVLAA